MSMEPSSTPPARPTDVSIALYNYYFSFVYVLYAQPAIKETSRQEFFAFLHGFSVRWEKAMSPGLMPRLFTSGSEYRT